MKRVTGIGGIFIKARNPVSLRARYQRHLGIDVQDWGGTSFAWKGPDNPDGGGTTVWSIASDDSEYFAPGSARFMVNYRVDDLAAVLDTLRAEGCSVEDKTEDSEFGKFGWVIDPENNKVELWQPPPGM